MKIHFTKMHGLGNDFVVLDATGRRWPAFVPNPGQARWLADRHFGVGCDQILVVEASGEPGVDFGYRIFNADGGEVEQCGNGARCFVRYVREQGLTDKDQIRVATRCGLITLALEADGRVRVDMGVPRFLPTEIPFLSQSDAAVQPLDVGGVSVQVSAVSMGNPHAVLVVDEIDTPLVAQLGPQIEAHPRFPQRVNVGFMQVLETQAIALRVYERGAGETLACGTGACAAAVAGIRRGLLASPVRVRTRGGELSIAWAGPGHPVLMTGPAVTVFSADIEIPEELS